MIRVTVLYPNESGKKFDMDYYTHKHMKLVSERLKTFGVVRTEVDKGVAVADCHVIEGKIVRGAKVRIVRDSVVAWDGKIGALKRFKDDVREVVEGFECGISLENFNDVKERDIIECYEIEEIKQKL